MDDGTPNGHLLGRNGYRDGSWDLAECMVDEGDIPMANEGDLTGAQYYENQGNTQECILAFIVD